MRPPVQPDRSYTGRAGYTGYDADRWRAYTVKGPWDLAITGRPGLPAPKRCENRTWWTNHRGPVLVHAGRAWDENADTDPKVRDWWSDLRGDLGSASIWPDRQLWTWAGHVTGVAYLADVHPDRGCCRPWGHSGTEINHHGLRDVVALDEPIPARGMPGLWKPSADLVGLVVAQLEAAPAALTGRT